jgi:putative spermidine/putrescine transport system ATP-binding protein
LLQVIGGYLPLKRGVVRANGVDISRLAPEKRDMGMVFQNYALFPHLSVRDNVSFPLEMRGTPRVERARKVESILDLVGLEAALRDRLPARLSG